MCGLSFLKRTVKKYHYHSFLIRPLFTIIIHCYWHGPPNQWDFGRLVLGMCLEFPDASDDQKRHPGQAVGFPLSPSSKAQFEAAQMQEQADFDESIVDMAGEPRMGPRTDSGEAAVGPNEGWFGPTEVGR